MRNLFQSHEADPRFQDPIRRQRIAGLYLPFVVIAVEGADFIKRDLAEDAKMDWLLCFVWVLRNSSRTAIVNWWQSETQICQISFLDLLALTCEVFLVRHQAVAQSLSRCARALSLSLSLTRDYFHVASRCPRCMNLFASLYKAWPSISFEPLSEICKNPAPPRSSPLCWRSLGSCLPIVAESSCRLSTTHCRT